MRQGPLLLGVLTTAIASSLPASAAAPVIRQVLSNGLTVLVEENHANPVVAIQVWVKVGSADERAEEAGISHVFEHMLFKGTERRAVGEIARTVESGGGDINAHTSFDQTVYELTIASDLFETGLDIMADAVFHSSFDAVELDREKEVVLEELKRSKDTPSRVVMEGLLAAAYGLHPYGRPIIGSEESIKGLTRERLLEFLRRWYRPGNMTLVVVGDVASQDALPAIERLFAAELPSPVERPLRAQEPEQRDFRFAQLRKESNQVYLDLAIPIPGVRDPLSHRYDILAQILGGGPGSRLHRRLKESAALVNSVSASSFTPVDQGLFIVGASFDPQVSAEEIIPLILEEMGKIARDLTEEEVRRAAVNLESDFVYRRQEVEGEASEIGFFETIIGSLPDRESYLDNIRGTTRQDVAALSAELFRPERMTVCLLASEGVALPGKERVEALTRASFPAGVPAPVAAGEKPDSAVLFTLANGIRLVVKPRPGVPVISCRAALLGGLRFDPPGKEGLSNLMAEVWSRGSRNYVRERIVTIMDENASSFRSFSGNNSVGLTLTTLARFREKTLPVLLDGLADPVFPEEEFAKAKTEALRRIRARKDDLVGSTIDLLAATLFSVHPYRFNSLGTERTVEALTLADVKAFYARHVRPASLVVAVVGDIDPDELRRTFEGSLGKWNPPGGEKPSVPVEPPLAASRTAEEQRADLAQAHLAIGFRGPAIADADRYAWEVLNAVLTGQGGRLFMKLRDEQSLAYAVSSFTALGVDPGYLGVYIGCSPEKIPAAEEGILAEMAGLAKEPVGAEELERAKRYLVGQQVISGQSYAQVASELVFAELYGMGYRQALEYAERIMAITAADLLRVAGRYLASGVHAQAIIRPKG